MTQSKQPKDDPAHPTATKPTVILLLGTVADTSWRLFIPAIGGTILGLVADNAFGTKPWATVAGVTLGALLAIGLVYAQLQKLNREQTK